MVEQEERLKVAAPSLLILDLKTKAKVDQLKSQQIQFVVFSADPKRDFFRVVSRYFFPPVQVGIHPGAFVDKSARLGSNCSIGFGAFLDEDVVVGDHVILGAGVRLLRGTRVGNHVTVHEGSVIGADGFGILASSDGWDTVPHIGGVRIEDHVHIGANTVVAKGTLGNTVIERGVRVNNLVHIAHNVLLGELSVLNAGVVICGSVQIGRKCWLGPGSVVRNGITLGDGSKLGMGAVLTENLPAHEIWTGLPASNSTEQKEMRLALRRLL
jgi:UDP-3-O-[3-hydroxymyristoyl] glucosamine N-acyltransferase